jgi:NAD(P)-dependent dehydrogenase (short-subunit alcohol dehydrogenase family)
MSERRLEGRVAVVTGASRGIGEAVARRMAAEQAAVAVSARTVEPGDSQFPGSLNETVASIRAAGGTVIAVEADLSKPDDRVHLIDQVTKELGPIDVLVNNAAVTWFEPTTDFNPRHYDVMFEVQVKAPVHLAQLVLPGMKERGHGWILNISSAAARHPQGPPYSDRRIGAGTVYGMCKAALERFTTGLAAEVWADGIAVNALSPSGPVATPGILYHQLVPPEHQDRFEPIELMVEASLALCSGTPQELTGRVAYSQQFLASGSPGREQV